METKGREGTREEEHGTTRPNCSFEALRKWRTNRGSDESVAIPWQPEHHEGFGFPGLSTHRPGN